MAKVRSPNYPNTDLGSALAMARKAFAKDHRNRMAQAALAKHLGNDSLSGPALAKIGVLRAYGLVDGAGDELRITDDAVIAITAPEGSPDRLEVLRKLAMRPALFREIGNDFAGVPSEDNLRFWLAKRGYTMEAAAKAASAYLATMELVTQPDGAYDPDSTELEDVVELEQPPAGPNLPKLARQLQAMQIKSEDTRQAVFPLTEGDVTIIFPANMSADAFEELSDYLGIFLKRAAAQAKPKADG